MNKVLKIKNWDKKTMEFPIRAVLVVNESYYKPYATFIEYDYGYYTEYKHGRFFNTLPEAEADYKNRRI